MIEMQIREKYGSGIPLAFHSNPAKTARTAEVRTRLAMYAIGHRVENDEGDGEAGNGRGQSQQSAFVEYPFAHGLEYASTARGIQHA